PYTSFPLFSFFLHDPLPIFFYPLSLHDALPIFCLLIASHIFIIVSRECIKSRYFWTSSFEAGRLSLVCWPTLALANARHAATTIARCFIGLSHGAKQA